MSEYIFRRADESGDQFAYDPDQGAIVISSPKAGGGRVEITIDANEWAALKKYAEEIGGDFT